jgi:hypothetical protein
MNYNAASDIDQSFTVIPGPARRVSGGITKYYSNIQDAFAEATDTDLVQSQGPIPSQDLNFSPATAISITLHCGYDPTFVSQIGYTSAKSMTITYGSVTVDGLMLQ